MSDKKKPISKFYGQVLTAIGLSVDDTGFVTLKQEGVNIPFTIEGKQLRVPTEEFLADPDWDNFWAFHPLGENLIRKKSLIHERTVKMAQHHLNGALTELILTMSKLAAETEQHSQVTTEQKGFLRLMEDADERTYKGIKDVLLKNMDGEEKALINLFVRRNGTWKGEEVARLCSVSFPVMDEEYTGGKAIYGKNLARVSDKEAFFKLIRHILPGIDEADLHYNYGSNSPVAPNFHALMMAYSRVAKDINAQLKIFESYNPALKAWIIPTNWTKEMSMLNDYRLDIPSSLPGNEGEADEGTLKEEKDRLAKEKGREERRELRDQHSRGGNRYTDNRGSRDEPRRASWGGGRRDERDDDRGGRGGNWGGRGRDDDRDDRDSRYSRDRGRSRDDYDDRRGRERDRDDRYSRDREDDRGRGRDDARETTSSGISRDWGESVRDDRSRDRGRGGWRR
ncbi:hypothetical protein CF95_gp012 [Erwinia phage PhiEaH1]|uniref:Uncharacterized protein n=1 Tax=Erwinia phage PhiEaH1 TaxID=1401669 RepID=W8D037_9CAUD|nr:hypothetical protein CF95_gp012 [Erwinia phage PhiEaH1]AGX01734.1 hypothetical protein [Erwinia phage PhiEaH1]